MPEPKYSVAAMRCILADRIHSSARFEDAQIEDLEALAAALRVVEAARELKRLMDSGAWPPIGDDLGTLVDNEFCSAISEWSD